MFPWIKYVGLTGWCPAFLLSDSELCLLPLTHIPTTNLNLSITWDLGWHLGCSGDWPPLSNSWCFGPQAYDSRFLSVLFVTFLAPKQLTFKKPQWKTSRESATLIYTLEDKKGPESDQIYSHLFNFNVSFRKVSLLLEFVSVGLKSNNLK